MTVAEALPTMTDAEKVKAWDALWQDYATRYSRHGGVTVSPSNSLGAIRAIAHVIADRKPDLAPWTPGYRDDYHSVGWRGALVSDAWQGITMETEARDFGNVFRTREEAEAHAARLRVFNRVFQMRAALGMMNLSPRDVMRFLTDSLDSNEADAIREQLEKEGAL